MIPISVRYIYKEDIAFGEGNSFIETYDGSYKEVSLVNASHIPTLEPIKTEFGDNIQKALEALKYKLENVYEVKINELDNTPGYLDEKVGSGLGINKRIANNKILFDVNLSEPLFIDNNGSISIRTVSPIVQQSYYPGVKAIKLNYDETKGLIEIDNKLAANIAEPLFFNDNGEISIRTVSPIVQQSYYPGVKAIKLNYDETKGLIEINNKLAANIAEPLFFDNNGSISIRTVSPIVQQSYYPGIKAIKLNYDETKGLSIIDNKLVINIYDKGGIKFNNNGEMFVDYMPIFDSNNNEYLNYGVKAIKKIDIDPYVSSLSIGATLMLENIDNSNYNGLKFLEIKADSQNEDDIGIIMVNSGGYLPDQTHYSSSVYISASYFFAKVKNHEFKIRYDGLSLTNNGKLIFRIRDNDSILPLSNAANTVLYKNTFNIFHLKNENAIGILLVDDEDIEKRFKISFDNNLDSVFFTFSTDNLSKTFKLLPSSDNVLSIRYNENENKVYLKIKKSNGDIIEKELLSV